MRTHIGWLVAGALLCGAGGAGWQARQPTLYRAVCVLDYGQEPIPTTGTPRASEEWYRTQDILLTSRALAERVVAELRLERERSFADPDAARGDAAGTLQQRLKIAPVPNTHAVRVMVDDTDPKRAARIANAVVSIYLEKAIDDRVTASQRALAWLNEQINGTGRRLAETELEMQTYLERQAGPALVPEERLAMVTEEIKRLTQALTDTRLSRIEVSARLAKLKDAVDTSNPFEARSQEIDSADDVKQLRAAYHTLLLEHEATAAGVSDKELPALGQKKLDALWGRMQSTLNGFVRSTQSELAALQQVETQLRGALERANASGHSLQQQQLEYLRLSRERSEAEQWLKALRDRSSAAGVMMAAGALGARVIDPATPPFERQPPQFLSGAAVGALAGLALSSLILALARRRRVPAVDDVEPASSARQIAE